MEVEDNERVFDITGDAEQTRLALAQAEINTLRQDLARQ